MRGYTRTLSRRHAPAGLRAARPPAILAVIRAYPFLTATLVAGALALTLQIAGFVEAGRWIVTVVAVSAAALEAWRMVRTLLRGRAGLDVLALAAIVSTLLVGEYWASFVIVLMLESGEALEEYAGRRAKRELSSLLERVPESAHRTEDGRITDVGLGEVRPGDVLVVRPGEVVPVDGVLVTASAQLDESQLTGESLPVEHSAGAALLSGSVNLSTAMTMTAVATAADSQYQKVIELVSEASESRAPIVRLADRWALPFTAGAVALAASAWAISGDPARFAEVLVVATPCPLLLAAPIAFLAGISRSARAGIIVRSGGGLELLSRARTVAFDKTGTLTLGRPAVVAVHPAAGFSEEEVLRHMAAAEQLSSHVLAQAIIAEAARRGGPVPPADTATETPAGGVVARVGRRTVVVGKRRFVEEHGAVVSSPPPAEGRMAVYAAVDGAYAGEVLLADPVRPNAASTVARLRASGITRVVMLTGDGAPTAEAVAAVVGVDDVEAGCLPQDKVRLMREEKARPVVMVGDGVNDAPVLAAADVGIAMGARGATAASESADVVVLVDDLARVATAVGIGRQTTAVAVQAIVVGIGLSAVLMVIAAFGYLPALAGAGLQELVDVATILYALRALADRPLPGEVDRADRGTSGRLVGAGTG